MTPVWIFMVVAGSVVFGSLHYAAKYDLQIESRNRYYKFLDWWRHFINYFITFIIVLYFVSVRWPHVAQNEGLSVGDFILGATFLMGIFGWLHYFAKNITMGIEAIVKRVLDR